MQFIRDLSFGRKALVLSGALAVPAAALAVLASPLGADGSTRALAVTVGALGLALGAWIGWAMLAAAGRDLGVTAAQASRMAAGDFTQEITADRADELGQLQSALAGMRGRVVTTLQGLLEGSQSVGQYAMQLGEAASELNTRTSRQAAALQEASAAVGEITAAMQQSAVHVGSSSQIALATRTRAERGGAISLQAVEAMNGISASSRKIVDIVSVVDEIAFQTNLLALNAAVEAARAGDAGRGFAVVAADVRSLAQRSASAAKEIKDLIQDSSLRVDGGGRLVGESGRHLGEIVAAVKQVADLIAEIGASHEEQSHGLATVSRTVAELDGNTQRNTSTVAETTAAAQAMSEQAARLAALTHHFRLPGRAPQAAVRSSPETAARPAAARPAAKTVAAPVKPSATKPSPARPARAASAAPAVERRSKTRPWSNRGGGSGSAAAAAPPTRAAAHSPGEDWTEF